MRRGNVADASNDTSGIAFVFDGRVRSDNRLRATARNVGVPIICGSDGARPVNDAAWINRCLDLARGGVPLDVSIEAEEGMPPRARIRAAGIDRPAIFRIIGNSLD